MRTIALQHMPNGHELELPPLTYWIKAGFGLGIGLAIVAVFLWLCSLSLFGMWMYAVTRPLHH